MPRPVAMTPTFLMSPTISNIDAAFHDLHGVWPNGLAREREPLAMARGGRTHRNEQDRKVALISSATTPAHQIITQVLLRARRRQRGSHRLRTRATTRP